MKKPDNNTFCMDCVHSKICLYKDTAQKLINDLTNFVKKAGDPFDAYLECEYFEDRPKVGICPIATTNGGTNNG